ncbi:hypothetical protein GGF44_001739 [Coemansia sp. RSA 1694]|nr:hypothetical protein GGF38_001297 [Coemansia sp. RSA 25]KAJ2509253.1 hypothetical protein IWW47_000055 [Coemansia sp. RSA 2052]KAJ2581394.1 hypothetical protein GGH95_002101 [Coemansia sp. RSA 1836]KAJ2642284.1 hypothetical protein GGF44_001739 [Coemansia sp. RSA 1694]
MAILALKTGVSIVFHRDELDPDTNDGQGVRGPAIEKFKTKFGLSTWEPTVYAVDYDESVRVLTENDDEIYYTTQFVCVAMADVVKRYLDKGTLHDHLIYSYASRRKSQ